MIIAAEPYLRENIDSDIEIKPWVKKIIHPFF